jgi:hypothetical protein
VLASGAATNDLINIYAFKSFTTADMVSKTAGGTFAGAVGFSGGATFPDSAELVFGTGSDFKISHNGSKTKIEDTGTGNLEIRGTNIEFYSGDGGETLAKLTDDGAAELYHNNTKRIETSSTGVDITGSVTADGLISDSITNASSNLLIASTQSATIRFDSDNNQTNREFNLQRNTSTGVLKAEESGDITFFKDDGTTAGLFWDASSGNVHVGKTTTGISTAGLSLRGDADVAQFTRDGGEPMELNRLSSDGPLIIFYKDSTQQGNIGANESYAYISGTTRGLRFGHSGSERQIVPVTASGQGSDNNVDLGSASLRFDDVYAYSGVTTGSDENDKQQIASLTAAEMTAAKAISKLFKTFKWNSAVKAKSDAARTHTGVMAQQVETALTDAGLNAGDYAFYMSNTWWETSTEVAAVEADEEAGIEAQDAYTRIDTYHTADEAPEGATQRTRLGIRYAELMAFVGAATEQRLADIETRLAALESG